MMHHCTSLFLLLLATPAAALQGSCCLPWCCAKSKQVHEEIEVHLQQGMLADQHVKVDQVLANQERILENQAQLLQMAASSKDETPQLRLGVSIPVQTLHLPPKHPSYRNSLSLRDMSKLTRLIDEIPTRFAKSLPKPPSDLPAPATTSVTSFPRTSVTNEEVGSGWHLLTSLTPNYSDRSSYFNLEDLEGNKEDT